MRTFHLLVVTANEVQDQLMVVHVLYPLPFDLTYGDIPPAGGDSRRNPRSAHTCSRFYPLPFDLTLGTFQLLVVTANEVQDQLIHVPDTCFCFVFVGAVVGE
jgi:hypothetical protein